MSPAKIVCFNCGTLSVAGSRYCRSCGHHLGDNRVVGWATGIGASGNKLPSSVMHPVVGTWLLRLDNFDDPATDLPTLAVFMADGNCQLQPSDSTPSLIGVWRVVDRRTAAATYLTIDQEEKTARKVRATIAVDLMDDCLRARYTISGSDIAASTLMDTLGPEEEIGPGTAFGRRMSVEPMGIPTASFEEVFGNAVDEFFRKLQSGGESE